MTATTAMNPRNPDGDDPSTDAEDAGSGDDVLEQDATDDSDRDSPTTDNHEVVLPRPCDPAGPYGERACSALT